MDLNLLSQKSYQTAKEKGWWDSPRSFSALSLLMVSELMEALDDYRNHRKVDEIYYEYKFGGVPMTCSEENVQQLPVGTNPKPCGIPVEIADFIIRVADYAGFAEIPLQQMYVNELLNRAVPEKYNAADFELCLSHSTLRVSLAFRAWATGDDLEYKKLLAWSLQPMFDTCTAHGIDIEKVINLKAAYNQTRSQRHGGKLI